MGGGRAPAGPSRQRKQGRPGWPRLVASALAQGGGTPASSLASPARVWSRLYCLGVRNQGVGHKPIPRFPKMNPKHSGFFPENTSRFPRKQPRVSQTNPPRNNTPGFHQKNSKDSVQQKIDRMRFRTRLFMLVIRHIHLSHKCKPYLHQRGGRGSVPITSEAVPSASANPRTWFKILNHELRGWSKVDGDGMEVQGLGPKV